MTDQSAFEPIPFDEKRDSIEEITKLLNKAYGVWKAQGVTFGAATQDAETTKGRIVSADGCWVVRWDDRIVGVIAYYARRRYGTEPEWYADKGVSHFGQFAVEPGLQGQGIGSRLIEMAEERARSDGKRELACDTAEGADSLLWLYRRRGYQQVAKHRWRNVDHDNIVLSKKLSERSRRVSTRESSTR